MASKKVWTERCPYCGRRIDTDKCYKDRGLGDEFATGYFEEYTCNHCQKTFRVWYDFTFSEVVADDFVDETAFDYEE